MNTQRKHPALPDFTRLPFRAAEAPTYRTDAPPDLANNPFYLAVPAPRSLGQIRETIEAGNPTFDPRVRELPALLRRERLDDVDAALFAIRRHVRLEDMVMTTIRNSYRARPYCKRYVEKAVSAANRVMAEPQLHAPYLGDSVGAGCLVGGPGEGKTRSFHRILLGCPQLVLHPKSQGGDAGVQQVLWLYLSMPQKASAYGLLNGLAAVLDFLLKTNYQRDVAGLKNDAARLQFVARILALHVVGAVFLDEAQNIGNGNITDRSVMEATLETLINYTHTRFVFVGTKKPTTYIRSEALLRRLCGERGQIMWSPLAGVEWQEFVQRLWPWQVTNPPTPLTAELVKALHLLTGGKPSLAKQLFTATQARIIDNPKTPDEQLTAIRFQRTLEENFEEDYRVFTVRWLTLNPEIPVKDAFIQPGTAASDAAPALVSVGDGI